MKKTLFFPLKTGTFGDRRGTVQDYCIPLVGCTDKTNTTDIQTVDWVYSKTIHLEMEEDHKTKETRDEGVEKHSCQIELRGAHVNLVYYMVNKYCDHTSWYMSLESCMWGAKRNISVYITSAYMYMYHIYIHIYIYIWTHTHTHTVKYSFYILARYLQFYTYCTYLQTKLYMYTWHLCTQYLNIQIFK
jgi:hypothetical protein